MPSELSMEKLGAPLMGEGEELHIFSNLILNPKSSLSRGDLEIGT